MGMKCIHCSTDNNLRERTTNQGRCKNCNHPFAFEPTSVADTKLRFTDPFFDKTIDDVSANNTLFFTPKQLFYILDRRLQSKSFDGKSWYFLYFFFSIFLGGVVGGALGWSAVFTSVFILVLVIFNLYCIIRAFRYSQNSKLSYRHRKAVANFLTVLGGFILISGILVSLTSNSYSIFVSSVLLGMLSIYLSTRPLKNEAITFLFDQNQFQGWVDRWSQVHNPIAKMLPSPIRGTTPAVISPDISAYSFDRAVICDSAEIAQLLIANNFHFENNCAVLSITGYPQDIFQTVMEMLRRNSNLKVYVIHDASPRGVGMVHQLRTSPNWFQNSNTMIYDLGLLPSQVLNSRNVFIRKSEESAQQARQMLPAVQANVSNEELLWLEAGNFVELESFSPQRIIHVINQGIARSQDPNASDGLVLIDNDMYGGGGFIYVNESFG